MIDGINSSKPPTVPQPQSSELKAVEAKPAAPATGAAAPPKPAEGFDDPKKKLMSVSGRYNAVPPPKANLDLKEAIASQRLAAQANITAGPTKAPAMTPGPGGVNPTNDAKPSAQGAISKKEWDNPQLLLGKLTQHPAGGETTNSTHRCGASSLLATALMNGPDATAAYLNKTADAPENNRLTDSQKTELHELADKVKNKTATFEDLSRAQDLTHTTGNRVTDFNKAIEDAIGSGKLDPSETSFLSLAGGRELTDWDRQRIGELVTKASGSPSRVVNDPDHPGVLLMTVMGDRRSTDASGFIGKEVRDLAQSGGLRPEDKPSDDLTGVIADLKPGESAVIRVAGDDADTEANHYITIGRRSDGTPYIYNPDPAKDDATVFVGAKGDKRGVAFNNELEKYQSRLKPDIDGQMPPYTKLRPD